jgi:hypothetical protein
MAPYDDRRLADVLRTYAEHPLQDGDAVLLLDDTVCLELTGLADRWDDDEVRSTTASVVRRTTSRVAVAIARRGGELRPGDYGLWRDLHADLRDTPVELLPVRSLPAA